MKSAFCCRAVRTAVVTKFRPLLTPTAACCGHSSRRSFSLYALSVCDVCRRRSALPTTTGLQSGIPGSGPAARVRGPVVRSGIGAPSLMSGATRPAMAALQYHLGSAPDVHILPNQLHALTAAARSGARTSAVRYSLRRPSGPTPAIGFKRRSASHKSRSAPAPFTPSYLAGMPTVLLGNLLRI